MITLLAALELACTGQLWATPPWDRVRGEAPVAQLSGPAFITIDRDLRSAAFRAPGTSFAGAIFDKHDSGTPEAWLTSSNGRPDGITGELLYYGEKNLAELGPGETASFGVAAESYVEMGEHGESGYRPGRYYELSCARPPR